MQLAIDGGELIGDGPVAALTTSGDLLGPFESPARIRATTSRSLFVRNSNQRVLSELATGIRWDRRTRNGEINDGTFAIDCVVVVPSHGGLVFEGAREEPIDPMVTASYQTPTMSA